MPAQIECSGEIEILCFPSAGGARTSASTFDKVTVGDRLSLVFSPTDGASAPYSLKVVSPSGATILDSVLRDIPTGLPQSPPPVELVISAKGPYRIEIREMRGRQRGQATVKIS